MPQSPPCIAMPSVLDAFRRREPSAVRALYRDYGRLVYAVALRVLGRADLADDATQRTFVRAWQAAGRFDVDRVGVVEAEHLDIVVVLVEEVVERRMSLSR